MWIVYVLASIAYIFVAFMCAGFAYFSDEAQKIGNGEEWVYIFLGLFWPIVIAGLILYQIGRIPFRLGEDIFIAYEARKNKTNNTEEATVNEDRNSQN